ncbi:MAG: hypothetical protein ACRDZ8_06395 [Acidimicrobiales bacterium]
MGAAAVLKLDEDEEVPAPEADAAVPEVPDTEVLVLEVPDPDVLVPEDPDTEVLVPEVPVPEVLVAEAPVAEALVDEAGVEADVPAVPAAWLVVAVLAAANPAKAPAAATALTPTTAVTLDSRRRPRSLALGELMGP